MFLKSSIILKQLWKRQCFFFCFRQSQTQLVNAHKSLQIHKVRKEKQVGQIISADRGTLFTLCAAVQSRPSATAQRLCLYSPG